MKARVIATGEIWEFSQIDEITFKSAINGHLYCAEELEFLEPSVFTPDYWTRLEHQYAGIVIGGMCGNTKYNDYAWVDMAKYAIEAAHILVEKMKEERK